MRRVGIVCSVGVLALVAGCGGGGSSSESGSELVELDSQLRGSAAINFAQLSDTTDLACEDGGAESRGRDLYRCTWLQGETPQEETFLLENGEVVRYSDGGQSSSPPDSPSEALARIAPPPEEDAVCVEQRSDDNDFVFEIPRYLCAPVPQGETTPILYGDRGATTIVRELRWTAAGTIERDAISEREWDEVIASSTGMAFSWQR